ncbi:MAG: hypothetical protein Q4F88_06965 [Eubacteriales bacterium]|nr:hypothetical protein [Eubacteriales bacterium]
MLYIKDIVKASVCSFCENIYEYNSIDENDFKEALMSFLREDDLQECLEICTSEIPYDCTNIENVCDNFRKLRYELFEIDSIVNNCKQAFLMTIQINKTINVKAFVDNLQKCFNKN